MLPGMLNLLPDRGPKIRQRRRDGLFGIKVTPVHDVRAMQAAWQSARVDAL